MNVHEHMTSFDAARKRQHLLDEIRAPLRRALNCLDQRRELLVFDLRLQDTDREKNRREHIVEIVRDSTGKRSNGFEPLRTEELLLELFLLGEIDDERDAFFRIIGERGRADENGNSRSVSPNVLLLIGSADAALRDFVALCAERSTPALCAA